MLLLLFNVRRLLDRLIACSQASLHAASLLVCMGLFTACDTTGPTTAAADAQVRFALAGSARSAGHTVFVGVAYGRLIPGGDTIPIWLDSTSLTVTTEVQVRTVTVDVSTCLSDPQRYPRVEGCGIFVDAVLKEPDGEVADEVVIGPLPAAAGAQITLPAIELSTIDSIEVAAPATIASNGTAQAVATVRRRNGTIATDRNIAWSSSDPSVATVSTGGVISALRFGTATIVATSGTHIGRTTVVVTPPLPIAYYDFNGDALDKSGNGRHGTVFNATLVADRLGAASRAFRFNGTSGSYISIGQLQLTGAFTLSAWYRPDAAAGGAAIISNLAGNFDQPPATGYELLLLGDAQGRVPRVHTRLNSSATATGAPWTLGQWRYVTATYESGRARLYVDGVLVGSNNFMTPPETSPHATVIGRSGYATSNFANGAVDDVSVFTRALTAAEVEALYTSGGRP